MKAARTNEDEERRACTHPTDGLATVPISFSFSLARSVCDTRV